MNVSNHQMVETSQDHYQAFKDMNLAYKVRLDMSKNVGKDGTNAYTVARFVSVSDPEIILEIAHYYPKGAICKDGVWYYIGKDLGNNIYEFDFSQYGKLFYLWGVQPNFDLTKLQLYGFEDKSGKVSPIVEENMATVIKYTGRSNPASSSSSASSSISSSASKPASATAAVSNSSSRASTKTETQAPPKESPAPEPSVKIHKSWLDLNYEKDGEKGTLIHLDMSVAGLKGKDLECISFLDCPKGTGVKDTNGKYRTTGGNVCASNSCCPGYDNTRYDDHTIFLPNSEIHPLPGKHDYFLHTFIRDNGKVLADVWSGSFSMTIDTDHNQQNNNQQHSNHQNNAPSGASAVIQSTYGEGNKRQNDINCIKLRAEGEVLNCAGHECTVSFYLYDSNKNKFMSAINSHKASDGQMAVSVNFTPTGNRYRYGIDAFIPQYEVIQALHGSNVEEFYVNCIIWCGDTNLTSFMSPTRMRFTYGTQTCNRCNGTGRAKCVLCNGSGRMATGKMISNSVWTGMGYIQMPAAEMTTCSRCNGAQIIDCFECEGHGTKYNCYTSIVGKTSQNNGGTGGSGGGNVIIINSGSGNSGSSSVIETNTRPQQCYSCGGTGNCRSCNGFGTAYTQTGKCYTCHGTGRCVGCRGTGHY